ncbi:MAG: hypothetical protein MK538_13415 [Planctomycetes bacterium]|nr:hypothetical protein [Planctomycetota bacterium]|tara:strand:- start:23 stop:502 length:480 start_codon:yes stop_codon:yes gene_type:complete
MIHRLRLLTVTLWVSFVVPPLHVDAADVQKTYRFTVYQLWGAEKESKQKPLKELKSLLPKLRKQSKKKSFRLVSPPIVRDLLPGQSVKAKLPQGYSAEWTLSEASGRPQVRQELTNPKKKKSVLRLKTRPFVTELSKITDDEDAFVLVVDFAEKTPDKK